jgi:hypothetical protein
LRPSGRARMQRISRLDERQEKPGVNECHDRFGNP